MVILLFRSKEAAAEQLCELAGERDDLQALLLATLDRLEAVEGVAKRADESSLLMEQKVGNPWVGMIRQTYALMVVIIQSWALLTDVTQSDGANLTGAKNA